jgi:hypothetical protein
MGSVRLRGRKGDPMRWTTEKPTKFGHYWWRDKSYEHGKPSICRITKMSGKVVCLFADIDETESALEGLDGEWAGPIPEPTEGECE